MFSMLDRIIAGCVLGVIVMLGLIGVMQTVRLGHARAALAQERLDRANETLAREELARRAEARIAAQEHANALAVQSLTEQHRQETADLEAAAAAARADGDRLRADAQAYAAGAGQRGGPAAAECRRLADRAGRLGHLFGDADKVAERLAQAAEREAANARTLKRQLLADRAACAPSP